MELSHPLIYNGVSAWERLDQAVANAQRFPALGGYVAEIRLNSACGARHYPWGAHPGHLTIWADALTLRERVTDTISVGAEE